MNQTTNFRLILQDELVARCRKNPKYSLRAFAKALEVGPSALSDMLNGKRPITQKMKHRLSLKLGLNLENLNVGYSQIAIDKFAFISDWYHYAILELMKIKDFQSDVTWIGKALGITKSEASAALERLQRLNLITQRNGKWEDTSAGFSTNIEGNLTSVASRALQKQVLEHAIAALDEVPVDMRNHTSMTMAIDPKYLPEAIETIKKFRRQLCNYLESHGKPKEVFELSIALFPVTKVGGT